LNTLYRSTPRSEANVMLKSLNDAPGSEFPARQHRIGTSTINNEQLTEATQDERQPQFSGRGGSDTTKIAEGCTRSAFAKGRQSPECCQAAFHVERDHSPVNRQRDQQNSRNTLSILWQPNRRSERDGGAEGIMHRKVESGAIGRDLVGGIYRSRRYWQRPEQIKIHPVSTVAP
jgi:hypothetical protein